MGGCLALALVLSGATSSSADVLTTREPAQALAVKAGAPISVKRLLNQLPEAKEHPKGYQRAKFVHWITRSGQSCTTRQRVLLRDATVKPRQGKNCRLSGGEWTSRYDNATVTRYGKLDIDHVVALKEAWDSGAWQWNAATRKAYANDLGYTGTLAAVTATSNRSKGDKDPADWLPRKGDRCRYIKAYVGVKWRWSLSVDAQEKAAISRVISTSCGTKLEMKAPKKATVSVLKSAAAAASSGTSTTTKTTTTTTTSVTEPFKNCAAARAAGAAPVHRGDPGYGPHLDGDGDGIGCE